MLDVVEGEDVFVSHHTESFVDGFAIEKHLFSGGINELMARIKSGTIQIILKSNVSSFYFLLYSYLLLILPRSALPLFKA